MKKEYKITPYKKDNWTFGGPFRVFAFDEEDALRVANIPIGWTALIEPV